jgi:hypothetical protein
MSNKQEPKKPRRPKSKRINLNKKSQWEKLINEINKEQVPIGVLRFLTVNLKDGTSIDLNIESMLDNGADPEIVQMVINDKLDSLDPVIADVDFHISVDSVANTIQPFTDQLLKNL